MEGRTDKGEGKKGRNDDICVIAVREFLLYGGASFGDKIFVDAKCISVWGRDNVMEMFFTVRNDLFNPRRNLTA